MIPPPRMTTFLHLASPYRVADMMLHRGFCTHRFTKSVFITGMELRIALWRVSLHGHGLRHGDNAEVASSPAVVTPDALCKLSSCR